MSQTVSLQRSTSRTETLPPPAPALPPRSVLVAGGGRYANLSASSNAHDLSLSSENPLPTQFRFSPRQEDPGLLASIATLAQQLQRHPGREGEALAMRLRSLLVSPSTVDQMRATEEGRQRLLALVEALQQSVRFLQARHTRVLQQCTALEGAITAAEQATEALRGDRDRIAQAYEGARTSGDFSHVPPVRSSSQDLLRRHEQTARTVAEGAARLNASSGPEDLRASQAGLFLDPRELLGRAEAEAVAQGGLDALKALRALLVNGVLPPSQLSPEASPATALANLLALLTLLLQYTAWKLEVSSARMARLAERLDRRKARVEDLRAKCEQLQAMTAKGRRRSVSARPPGAERERDRPASVSSAGAAAGPHDLAAAARAPSSAVASQQPRPQATPREPVPAPATPPSSGGGSASTNPSSPGLVVMSRTNLPNGRRVVMDVGTLPPQAPPEVAAPLPAQPYAQPPPQQAHYYYSPTVTVAPLAQGEAALPAPLAGVVTRRPNFTTSSLPSTIQSNIDRVAVQHDYRPSQDPSVQRLEEDVKAAASWRPEPPRTLVRGPTETQIRNNEDEAVMRMLSLVLQGAHLEAERQMHSKNQHAQKKVDYHIRTVSSKFYQ